MDSSPNGIVVIDFDDVLIDCYKSFLTASIRTVEVYLNKVLGIQGPSSGLLSSKEVEQFANAYGFTPGMDLSYVLLLYFLSILGKRYSVEEYGAMDPKTIIETIKEKDPIQKTMADLKKQKRLSDLGKILRLRGGGIHALNKLVDLPNRFLAFNEGHITMDNYLHRVFEEVYLGEELFKTEYEQDRMFSRDSGTIHMEEPRFTMDQFKRMRNRLRLATVTERTQARVMYLLNLLGLTDVFSAVVSAESTNMNANDTEYGVEMLGVADTQVRNFVAELVSAIERLSAGQEWQSTSKIIYVGDTSNPAKDLSMIKDRYRLTVLGFSLDKRKRQALKQGGADSVAFDTNQVMHQLTDRDHKRTTRRRWR